MGLHGNSLIGWGRTLPKHIIPISMCFIKNVYLLSRHFTIMAKFELNLNSNDIGTGLTQLIEFQKEPGPQIAAELQLGSCVSSDQQTSRISFKVGLCIYKLCGAVYTPQGASLQDNWSKEKDRKDVTYVHCCTGAAKLSSRKARRYEIGLRSPTQLLPKRERGWSRPAERAAPIDQWPCLHL